jgi:hypothetical protein
MPRLRPSCKPLGTGPLPINRPCSDRTAIGEVKVRFLRLTLIVAVVTVPMAIAVSSPVNAARTCKCSGITSGGSCTRWGDCHEVLESVGTFRPVRSARDCRRSQMLLCDDNSCKLVCYSNKK